MLFSTTKIRVNEKTRLITVTKRRGLFKKDTMVFDSPWFETNSLGEVLDTFIQKQAERNRLERQARQIFEKGKIY